MECGRLREVHCNRMVVVFRCCRRERRERWVWFGVEGILKDGVRGEEIMLPLASAEVVAWLFDRCLYFRFLFFAVFVVLVPLSPGFCNTMLEFVPFDENDGSDESGPEEWPTDICQATTSASTFDPAHHQADIAKAIPSILSSDLPKCVLHSGRRNITCRHSSQHYTTILRRVLRLPVSHLSRRSVCRCKQLIDIFGDHYFECVYHSKLRLHNNIRDALYHVLQELAVLSGFVYSSHDILHEPLGLSKSHPTRRPADVCIRLHHHHSNQYRPCRFTYAGIDVTITGSPSCCQDATTQTTTNIRQHMGKEIGKWRGRSKRQDDGPSVIKGLLDNDTVLMPFTVGPWGDLGPMARRLLHGDELPDGASHPLTERSNEATTTMFNLAWSSESPSALLPRASKAWAIRHDHKWFGTCSHDATPTGWARGFLSASMSRAITSHLLAGMRRHTADGVTGSKPPKHIFGSNSRSHNSVSASSLSASRNATRDSHTNNSQPWSLIPANLNSSGSRGSRVGSRSNAGVQRPAAHL